MGQVKNFHIFVEGRVQGVGFRAYVHKKAKARGLKGWVRNLLDGRVEIQVSGPENELEAFHEEVRKGPAFSSVREVKIESQPQVMTEEFEIAKDEEIP